MWPLLLILSTTLTAQTSVRVEVQSKEAVALAASLEAAGFDVLPMSVGPTSLQLILAPGEEALLEPYGLTTTVLERGRPYTEIAAELGEIPGPDPAVPSGYYDLATIESRMNGFAASYPNLCRVVDLTAEYGMPTTFEGRSIKAVVISDNVALDEDDNGFSIGLARVFDELPDLRRLFYLHVFMADLADDVARADLPVGGGAAVLDLGDDDALDAFIEFEPLAQLGRYR